MVRECGNFEQSDEFSNNSHFFAREDISPDLAEWEKFELNFVDALGFSGPLFKTSLTAVEKLVRHYFDEETADDLLEQIKTSLECFLKFDSKASGGFIPDEALRTRRPNRALAAHQILHIIWERYREIKEWRVAINEIAIPIQSTTGIEIAPGAKIASCVCIDHGHGTVIGETAIIGDNTVGAIVEIYHAFTAGWSGKEVLDRDSGVLRRHPRIGVNGSELAGYEKNKIFIANDVKILGPVEIEIGVKIGSGTGVTNSYVCEGATIDQGMKVKNTIVPPGVWLVGVDQSESHKYYVSVETKDGLSRKSIILPKFDICKVNDPDYVTRKKIAAVVAIGQLGS